MREAALKCFSAAGASRGWITPEIAGSGSSVDSTMPFSSLLISLHGGRVGEGVLLQREKDRVS